MADTASSRQTAFKALMRVETDGSYSNITLDHMLSQSSLSKRDKSFAAGLFYGTVEKKLLLDYNISVYSQRPIGEIDKRAVVILRMGLYQLFFMDGVRDSAAVNESVELCRINGCRKASGFVNGILRTAARAGEIRLPDPKKGKNKYYSIQYSCPEPIVRLWRKSYGDENTLGILKSLEGRPPFCIRVNTLKTNAQELKASLEKMGVRAEYTDTAEDSLILYGTGAVEELPQFSEGLFHVQDTASQLCCRILSPKENETVLDVCSAPGGKSFTCGELMNNKGRIISCDLYSSRLKLVSSGAERLSLDIIKTHECDASKPDLDIKADRVLCDVPCSGLGIIRRKPELRYKSDLGLEQLPEIQYSILSSCAGLVKKGGVLVYSTCTLNPKENNENAERFLMEHKEFEPFDIELPVGIKRGIEEKPHELTLFPHINSTDGFFISRFIRT